MQHGFFNPAQPHDVLPRLRALAPDTPLRHDIGGLEMTAAAKKPTD
jgi:hypothetical protein